METAERLSLDPDTITKYFHGRGKDLPDEDAFRRLVGHAKERRTGEWVLIGAGIRSAIGRDLPNIEASDPRGLKDLVTAAAIAEDKLALIENRLPGQQPLSLQLLVNGDIDARTINISDRESPALGFCWTLD